MHEIIIAMIYISLYFLFISLYLPAKKSPEHR